MEGNDHGHTAVPTPWKVVAQQRAGREARQAASLPPGAAPGDPDAGSHGPVGRWTSPDGGRGPTLWQEDQPQRDGIVVAVLKSLGLFLLAVACGCVALWITFFDVLALPDRSSQRTVDAGPPGWFTLGVVAAVLYWSLLGLWALIRTTEWWWWPPDRLRLKLRIVGGAMNGVCALAFGGLAFAGTLVGHAGFRTMELGFTAVTALVCALVLVEPFVSGSASAAAVPPRHAPTQEGTDGSARTLGAFAAVLELFGRGR